MSLDVVIIRNCDGYQILHGHLHLANLLNRSTCVSVDVKGEGPVTIVRTRDGIFVDNGKEQLALRQT